MEAKETGKGDSDMAQGKWKCMALVASALALAGLFLSPSVVRAGENKGRISLSAGVDFPTAYFFRGLRVVEEGFIAQPYADATINLYEGEKGLNSVGATVGIWNSFHSESPGVDVNDPTAWLEADFYGGFTFGFLDNWETGVTYVAYLSPNNFFTSFQEISFSLSFDDSELLGDFALSPQMLVAVEFQGPGADAAGKGTYFQLGVEPGLTVIESENYPVSLSFPLTLGLSLGSYYEDLVTGDDDTFGYFDGGIVVSMPLGFIPADYGSWEIYASGHFLFLGDSAKSFNDGDDFQAIGMFGISLAY